MKQIHHLQINQIITKINFPELNISPIKSKYYKNNKNNSILPPNISFTSNEISKIIHKNFNDDTNIASESQLNITNFTYNGNLDLNTTLDLSYNQHQMHNRSSF